MRPACQVTVDGSAVSDHFTRRLVSCEVVDKDGVSSDTVRLMLDDSPPAEIPAAGAIIDVAMGYEGALVGMGRYVAEEVEVTCLPYAIAITGKAAEMGGPAKDMKRRHWDQATLGEVVKTVAADMGLEAVVDNGLSGFKADWWGQIAESNAAFLERLAERHGALFSVKGGRLIFARRGTAQSATGKALTQIVLPPDVIQPGTCRVTFSTRTRYRKVNATWMDRASGEKATVEVEGDSSAEGTYDIGSPFGSEAEALAAARAKAGRLGRGKLSFSVSVVGDTRIRAGAPLVFRGVRPGLDDTPLLIEQATHRYSKQAGYTTEITGSVQD